MRLKLHGFTLCVRVITNIVSLGRNRALVLHGVLTNQVEVHSACGHVDLFRLRTRGVPVCLPRTDRALLTSIMGGKDSGPKSARNIKGQSYSETKTNYSRQAVRRKVSLLIPRLALEMIKGEDTIPTPGAKYMTNKQDKIQTLSGGNIYPISSKTRQRKNRV